MKENTVLVLNDCPSCGESDKQTHHSKDLPSIPLFWVLKFLNESNNSNFFQTNPGFLVFPTIAQALGKDPLHYWLDRSIQQGTRERFLILTLYQISGTVVSPQTPRIYVMSPEPLQKPSMMWPSFAGTL